MRVWVWVWVLSVGRSGSVGDEWRGDGVGGVDERRRVLTVVLLFFLLFLLLLFPLVFVLLVFLQVKTVQ